MAASMLTPEDVADKLQLHHLTILKFIRTKKLKAVKLGRVYRIRPGDLESFLDHQSTF